MTILHRAQQPNPAGATIGGHSANRRCRGVQEIRANVRKVLAAVLIAAHMDHLKIHDFVESAFGGSAKAVKGV
jgi:hypothetical protein